MRMISFALTTEQFLNNTKTVTRRLGWKNLKPGTILMGVRKGMGLKLGEKVEKLGPLRVLSVRRERLDAITQAEVIREGFPTFWAESFVSMFCRNMGIRPSDEVTRIEFERITDEEAARAD